jgi:hypothetical protein
MRLEGGELNPSLCDGHNQHFSKRHLVHGLTEKLGNQPVAMLPGAQLEDLIEDGQCQLSCPAFSAEYVYGHGVSELIPER